MVKTVVNGAPWVFDIDDYELLIDVVRDRLGLRGTKRSCEVEVCGACTVLLDGVAVSACMTLGAELDGRELITVEGLAAGEMLHPVQEAFIKHGAVQCGFCTPGMVMSVCALLADRPDADEAGVREYLSGNICRCTGYVKILEATAEALVDAGRVGSGASE
jgi:carbon-monoxide dehydrogenase small subunit